MSEQVPPVRGLVAGKYELLGLIGRGGMGSVWEGRHVSLGTRVAIKFVDHADSAEARTRFLTEARAAATIQSKHAIQIFDHGVTEDDERPYIVMELLVGEPLDQRIERLGCLSLPETARIMGQACRALQRGHDAGIIHRDLKPENIFLVRSPDDDDEIAKVLDFGIAKFKSMPGSGLTHSTKTGAVLGTPYYMSPEQARGLRDIDHRTDLWSLGVIAYKCVTGALPFDGESVGDLLVKICTAPPPVPSLVVPGLDPAFDAWFAHALEREPARRFASATELAEALTLAAGVASRRSSEQGTPKPLSVRESPAAAPLPAAAVTSAPFTASSPPPLRAPQRMMVGIVAAAVTGASLGVLGVVTLFASPASTTATARPSAPRDDIPAPSHEPTATRLSPPATVDVPAAELPNHTAPTTPAASSSAAAIAASLAVAPPPRPAPSAAPPPPTHTAIATATAKPPAPAAPPAKSGSLSPLPAVLSPTPKAPAQADPGY